MGPWGGRQAGSFVPPSAPSPSLSLFSSSRPYLLLPALSGPVPGRLDRPAAPAFKSASRSLRSRPSAGAAGADFKARRPQPDPVEGGAGELRREAGFGGFPFHPAAAAGRRPRGGPARPRWASPCRAATGKGGLGAPRGRAAERGRAEPRLGASPACAVGPQASPCLSLGLSFPKCPAPCPGSPGAGPFWGGAFGNIQWPLDSCDRNRKLSWEPGLSLGYLPLIPPIPPGKNRFLHQPSPARSVTCGPAWPPLRLSFLEC